MLAKPVKKGIPKKWSSRPEEATAEEVALWEFEEFNWGDRLRILIKLLSMLETQQREDIQAEITRRRKHKFVLDIMDMLKVLREDFAGADQDQITVLSTKIFLAYQFSNPQICVENSDAAVIWESAILDTASVDLFCTILDNFLNRSNLWTAAKSRVSKRTLEGSLGDLREVINLPKANDEGGGRGDDGRLAGTPREGDRKVVMWLNANAEQS